MLIALLAGLVVSTHALISAFGPIHPSAAFAVHIKYTLRVVIVSFHIYWSWDLRIGKALCTDIRVTIETQRFAIIPIAISVGFEL